MHSRVLLAVAQQAVHKASEMGKKPIWRLMGFFTRRAAKQDKPHQRLFCNACTFAGLSVMVLGVTDAMKGPLQRCAQVSAIVKAPLRNIFGSLIDVSH